MAGTHPKRDAVIHAVTADAFTRAPVFDPRNIFLFDPDEPHKSAEEIHREMGGTMIDPRTINHNCPFCNRTMAWDLFRVHMEDCYIRNRLVKLDITKRKFAGASPEPEPNRMDATIHALVAGAVADSDIGGS